MKIVNIGSSFAAGPGIPPQIEPNAGRSGSNYAHLLAKTLDADLVDLSISGATLLTMLREPQTASGQTFPPQIDSLPPDADLVLVLGGGNDMKYLLEIFTDTWMGWLAMQMTRVLSVVTGATPPPADEDEVYRRFGVLLEAIHLSAPEAKVIIVEYLTLFGPDAKPGVNVPSTAQRMEHHRGTAMQLQRATNKVADERQQWCSVVHAAALSEAHGLGSSDPWVSGLDLPTLMRKEVWAHPNLKGMEAVANMLEEHLASNSGNET